MVAIVLPGGSCARVDHGPDLDQASSTMERAYGLRPPWRQQMELQELRINEARLLSLAQAVGLALANNRALRADLEIIGQARAEVVQAGLLSNPTLSIMLGFPEGGGLANFAPGLSKDFADLWLIPSRKRAAQAMLQQRILSITDAAIELVTEARVTYATLQYQSLGADLQQENLHILQDAMGIAEARLRAGDTTQLDVNLIRARYVEAEIELLQLRSDFRVSQRTLLRLMGHSQGPDDWQPEPMPLNSPMDSLSAGESALVEAALWQRLDVQAARWDLESAVADFEQQQLRVIPSLDIGIAGERFERRAQPGRNVLADTARASIAAGQLTAPEIQSVAERRREREQEIQYILGPTLDVPLPIFDQNQAQIARAQFRARELQQRYEEIEQRVVEGVRSALTQRKLAADRVRLYRESLIPLQEANLALAQTSYKAGRESILTVLLAQESLIRTRLAYAASVRDLAISIAVLERQLGGRLANPTSAPSSQPATTPAGGPSANERGE